MGNVYYPDGVPVSASFTQQVYPMPSVKVLGDLKVTSCINAEASIPVILTGQAPWSLSLSVDGKKSIQFNDIMSPEFTLSLNEWTDVPGEFDIFFDSVSDHAGCQSETSLDTIKLKVLSERPKANLECAHPIPFTGEPVNISMSLEGV